MCHAGHDGPDDRSVSPTVVARGLWCSALQTSTEGTRLHAPPSSLLLGCSRIVKVSWKVHENLNFLLQTPFSSDLDYFPVSTYFIRHPPFTSYYLVDSLRSSSGDYGGFLVTDKTSPRGRSLGIWDPNENLYPSVRTTRHLSHWHSSSESCGSTPSTTSFCPPQWPRLRFPFYPPFFQDGPNGSLSICSFSSSSFFFYLSLTNSCCCRFYGSVSGELFWGSSLVYASYRR